MTKGKYQSALDQDWTDIEVSPKNPDIHQPYFLTRDEVEIEGQNVYVIDRSGKRAGYVPLTRCAFVKFIHFGGEKPTVPELP